MASDLEMGLTTYDHIGIGVLDYADKEIVIQAEAGRAAASAWAQDCHWVKDLLDVWRGRAK